MQYKTNLSAFLFLCMFSFSQKLFCQKISNEFITGIWTVKNVFFDEKFMDNEVLKKYKKGNFDKARIKILQSKFCFKPNHSFDYNIDSKEFNFKNQHWFLNQNTIFIKPNFYENDLIAELEVVIYKNKVYFIIAETGIKLEVQKE